MRFATSNGASQLAEAQGDRELPQLDGPIGVPPIFSDYYKLMADLLVLAWQTDMTRVCTFQIGHEMSGRAYPELGFGDAHHAVTHHQGDHDKDREGRADQHLPYEDAGLLSRQAALHPDGDGSLLDHSIILYGGALSDGNQHLYTDLPLLLVAGGVAGIKGGRHVRYPRGTPMGNLLLTMLDKANVPHVDKAGRQHGEARSGLRLNRAI